MKKHGKQPKDKIRQPFKWGAYITLRSGKERLWHFHQEKCFPPFQSLTLF